MKPYSLVVASEMSNKDEVNRKKLEYISGLLGRKRNPTFKSNYESSSDFEDISDIYSNLNMMLTTVPIVTDDYFSKTYEAQSQVERSISLIYKGLIESSSNDVHNEEFQRTLHNQYIENSLTSGLPYYYRSLDANHGWLLYWLINSYALINKENFDVNIRSLVKDKINRNIVNNGLGGIAGGSNQIGHIAACYASILSLVLVDDFETLDRIRPNIYKWLMSLKTANGSFMMHHNGESDTRSTYCALVIASLLNISTDELRHGVLAWIKQCQTYEGGFAGVPNTEAHGGYTFCAIACYFLLLNPANGDLLEQISNEIDFDLLIRWSVMRQYQLEGGLSGRTNKLVDACYSFWIGAIFPMVEVITKNKCIFNRDSLKSYIINCCQNVDTGGFKDKPGKSVDFYHTNYALCGLSISEHFFKLTSPKDSKHDAFAYSIGAEAINELDTITKCINPIFSLPIGVPEKCKRHFEKLDQVHK